MIQYQRVPLDRIVDLRHTILRADQPRESAIFEGDNEEATAHFAAVDVGRIVGCVTITNRPLNNIDAWQLRGMAVAPAWRRVGVGATLLSSVESYVRDTGSSLLIWCNAREPAIGFYTWAGWEVVSERFDIPTAGPHVRMIKHLTAGSAASDRPKQV